MAKKQSKPKELTAGPEEFTKLAKPHVARAGFQIYQSLSRTGDNLWNPGDVDRLTFATRKHFGKTIKHCRFYFRHDPLASTVINKMVDLAINDIVVQTNGKASVTEEAIFNSLAKDVVPFMRKAAYEYLITGLVVPEIKLTRVRKKVLRDKGIKRLTSLLYPTSMWVRDSSSIEIKRPMISEKESYFILLGDELIYFIQNKGVYSDGSKDKELYKELAKLYPKLIRAVMNNEDKLLLENPLIVKSNSIEDSPYPIPYLFPALESLKYKRNLRRMDYSLAARVISAILHVKIGSDEYPLTEDQDEILADMENKFQWRSGVSTPEEVERLFALFTNHTVDIEWIFPEITALLDDKKYESVNQDIMVALGFPRILITGETERSFASDPQIATISPLHSMERMRDQLLPIVEKLFIEMKNHNRTVNIIPDIIKWKPINLMSMQLFYEGIRDLYEKGNLSRSELAEAYGFDLRTSLDKRVIEDDLFEELDLEPVAPSNVPGAPGGEEPGRPTEPPESS
jgi:hypothetical protein